MLYHFLSVPRHGCLSTPYETDYIVPPLTDRTEFWRYAHDLTVKHNCAKASREPLKALRAKGRSPNPPKSTAQTPKIQSELGVASYGDLGALFRRESSNMAQSAPLQSADYAAWNRPLAQTRRNLRLEDVFHVARLAQFNNAPPVALSAHVLYGRLNYFLAYSAPLVRQGEALRLRDEIVDVLRMAAEQES